VGTPLALVVEDKADLAEVAAADYSAAIAAAGGAAAAAAPAAVAPAAAAAAASHSSASSAAAVGALPSTAVFPSARLLMANHHVDPAPLVARGGSGKGGRITKADVLLHLGKIDAAAVGAPVKAAPAPAPAAAKPAAAPAAAAAPKPAPSAPVSFAVPERAGGTHTDVKPSTVRRVIAARLTESKAGIPHQYAIMDCRIDALMKLRATLKDAGVTVSVNDMVIKAAAKALRDVPEVNCFYEPKRCARAVRARWLEGDELVWRV
jgi:pyruvate dehydrogenase E2 component (dihydrolipoamide acetyltransferase)